MCTTHHVIGLNLLAERRQCEHASQTDLLKADLLQDVVNQLAWDPLIRDAQMQRLLVLAYNGEGEAIKARWLRRMLSQQEADGGWLGHSRIPELARWGDLRYWRSLLKGPEQRDDVVFDFHATAQVILLLTLLTNGSEPSGI